MKDYVTAIKNSNLTIYDLIKEIDGLFIPKDTLQKILNKFLVGTSLDGMPPRTRSKFVKESICKALGYPIPNTFKKTQPRFIGQNFDVYIQKSNNLQIWNEKISPTRRYVIIQVKNDIISNLKIVLGEELLKYDKTGTLTIKHQATFCKRENSSELLSDDTNNIKSLLLNSNSNSINKSPTDQPCSTDLFSIKDIFLKLKNIVGTKIKDSGFDQDRNRGAELHKIACQMLGYQNYKDNGKFPDILNQLVEVKLQTSPTIDLGKICPNDISQLSNIKIGEVAIRNCDIRYAIFYGVIKDNYVEITKFYLTTGTDFFDYFPQFMGKVVNGKIQLPLPKNFYES